MPSIIQSVSHQKFKGEAFLLGIEGTWLFISSAALVTSLLVAGNNASIVWHSCSVCTCTYISRGAQVDTAPTAIEVFNPGNFTAQSRSRQSPNDRIIATTWFIYKVFSDLYFLFFLSTTGTRCSTALSGVITVEVNPAIASSTPLQLRKTFCAPTGKTANQAIHLAYAGTANTPPSPLSIIATNLTASSRTSTTGAKNLLAHDSRTAANMPLSN